ncbi:MAG: MFS transporter [Gammaproteobacteria bacterium]|nr:MFS transporter [Gammaproteobacteria bacterium]
MGDRRLLYANAFLRALATGLIGVLLGLYLAQRGFPASAVGLVIGSGLAGAALSTLIVTYLGDRLGRRRTLVVLSLLSAAGGAGLIFSDHILIVCVVAFLGMVNGMGRDRGASLVLDHAILPSTPGPRERTRAFADGNEARGVVQGRTVYAFAWYNVLQDIGHALGAVVAGLPVLLRMAFDVPEPLGYAVALGLYALLLLTTAVLYSLLSSAVEANGGVPVLVPVTVAPESRRMVRRISGLFLIDSLAGGFLGTALLSYFFFERFGAGAGAIAMLFFFARAANAVSHFGAAWLAARIGLVNTMVFTHIPSSLMLVVVALVPEFWMAAVLFIMRELLVEMDVPTRQSYVMAVVRPDERTWASGVTTLVRMGGWAVAPFAAGFLMQGVALAVPLLIGAGMKIGYDLLLWKSFHDLMPPEEQEK